ncbi:SSI family serine proteinase inhibitor [Streptomyces sp. NPDC046939]|uniref:SSI family serine proteinase inhibitor n=1 Tax=Streptomyces sp. NPDC046939 TaxID=3155376 RepID=UPI0033F2BF00
MLMRRFSSRFASRPASQPASRSASRASALPAPTPRASRLAPRLLLTAVASVAALAAVPVAAHADTGPTRVPPSPFGSLDGPGDPDAFGGFDGLDGLDGFGGFGGGLRPVDGHGGRGADRLTVSVTDSGTNSDGAHELRCGPDGGTHPDPAAACDRLEEITRDGQDPFAPVPKGANCTMQYGGDATAHITGTWHGRPVDATYKLTNGCEISRWNRMIPVLPATAS